HTMSSKYADNIYTEKINLFQKRLEELAIEKELILSRIFATKIRLAEIRDDLTEINQSSIERIEASQKLLENNVHLKSIS
ncbi:MAG: hypothetical protein AAGI07_20105, partial [Bacteroidota bacterium]